MQIQELKHKELSDPIMKVYQFTLKAGPRDWGSEDNIKPMTIKTVFYNNLKKWLYLIKKSEKFMEKL